MNNEQANNIANEIVRVIFSADSLTEQLKNLDSATMVALIEMAARKVKAIG